MNGVAAHWRVTSVASEIADAACSKAGSAGTVDEWSETGSYPEVAPVWSPSAYQHRPDRVAKAIGADKPAFLSLGRRPRAWPIHSPDVTFGQLDRRWRTRRRAEGRFWKPV